MKNFSKILFCKILIIFFTNNIPAQQITFNKVYDFAPSSVMYSRAFSVLQTVDTGYVLAGSITNKVGTQWNTDVLIIKTNKYGDTLWTKTYGGGLRDYAQDIQKTSDGGYIVAGRRDYYVDMVNFFMYGDIWILKLDQNGDTLWTKTYGGPYNDYANSIKQTSDGGYILCGTKDSYKINVLGDIWVLKLDQNGDTTWTKTYHFTNYVSEANQVFETNLGYYYMVGSSAAGSSSISDILIIKLQNNGDSIWCKKLTGYIGKDIIQLEDSNIVVAGRGNTGGLLYKLNKDGNIIWVKNCPPDQGFYYQINSLTLDADENIILAGQKTNTNDVVNRPDDLWVQKFSTNGDSLWAKIYDFSLHDVGFEIRTTDDNGYVIAGETNGYAWLFKLNEDGDTLTNIIKEKNNFKVWNYPNPFSNYTTIYYQFPEQGLKNFEISLYNDQGVMIKTFSPDNPSEGFTTIDAGNLTPGVYFYKITTEKFSVCRKMILIK
jgi:hypothetical protein